jgi:hypothetical protein
MKGPNRVAIVRRSSSVMATSCNDSYDMSRSRQVHDLRVVSEPPLYVASCLGFVGDQRSKDHPLTLDMLQLILQQ